MKQTRVFLLASDSCLLSKMKIVFAGSPRFAIPTLVELVAAGHEIQAVFTQPDRPVGRKQIAQAPPVKETAQKLLLTVHQPEKIKSDEAKELLTRLAPDAMVVVGYGQILPPWLLKLPRYGCINLHASLLPAYRGAAPIQWAVANGEVKTGVTTMLIDEGLDTGPVLMRWETEIGPEETAIELGERLSVIGADLIIETLKGLEEGTLVARPQDNSRASRAPLLKKEHGRVDWSLSAQEVCNRVRGFLPWPGAYSGFRGQKLQIWRAKPRPEEGSPAGGPGELLTEKDELLVVCGGGTMLELIEVQLEGKRRMAARDFIHGARPREREKLELQF